MTLFARALVAASVAAVALAAPARAEGWEFIVTPYFMAPDDQTHVPMVVWMSDRFTATLALDKACLAQVSRPGTETQGGPGLAPRPAQHRRRGPGEEEAGPLHWGKTTVTGPCLDVTIP